MSNKVLAGAKKNQGSTGKLDFNEPMNSKIPLLATQNLTKTFQSGNNTLSILEDINLTIEKGESLAVVGASGSGKSTLLYLLGALDQPTSGHILFHGQKLASSKSLALWRNLHVGFVFQFHHLLSDFNALENAAMPARIAGLSPNEALAKAEPILKRVGLESRLNHRPGQLSGGEQQRVALARALVMEPELLLADEPTGNLDSKNSGAVNHLIMELVGEHNLSCVVVTHNNELAKMMKSSYELKNGQLKRNN